MAFGLKSKEEKFFSMLNDHAKLCHDASELMLAAFNGEKDKQEVLKKVDEMEKKADDIVFATMQRLQKTFITPMDREDIQLLIDQLDTTIDTMKEIMDKMCMYNVGEPIDGAIKMATIIEKCLKHIVKAMSYINSLKKNYVKVEGRILEVLRLEEEADDVYHKEMAALFTECPDAITIIKWKDILDASEDLVDDCEDIVGTFRRVVLKYA